jgi:hypothetical protein
MRRRLIPMTSRSADFPVCRIADFPVGKGVKARSAREDGGTSGCVEQGRFSRISRLKACDTAGRNACATGMT